MSANNCTKEYFSLPPSGEEMHSRRDEGSQLIGQLLQEQSVREGRIQALQAQAIGAAQDMAQLHADCAHKDSHIAALQRQLNDKTLVQDEVNRLKVC